MKKYSSVYFLFLYCVILAHFSAFTTIKAMVQAPFQALLLDRQTKYILPDEAQQNFKDYSFTIFVPDQNEFVNAPIGSALFPQDTNLAKQYDALIALFAQSPDCVVLCRKIHTIALLQLYNHLMKIFVNFNMHHPGTTQVVGDVVVRVQEYKQNERVFATNKKALFVNMLMELIETQFNGIIRQLIPGVQHYQATVAGKTFVQSDYGIDLTTLLVQEVDQALIEKQMMYTTCLETYISFFDQYTKYIALVDTTTQQNQFVRTAGRIVKLFAGKDSFFFVQPDALHFVQTSKQKMQDIVHTQVVGWPQFIMTQVEQGKTGMLQSLGVEYPLAYFADKNGNRVANIAQAKSLFVVIPEQDKLFVQELLQEPKWMHSIQGMQDIIKACFGNVASLVHKGILDPWTEAVIQKVYKK